MKGKHTSDLIADIEKLNQEKTGTYEMWNIMLQTKIALSAAALADTLEDISEERQDIVHNMNLEEFKRFATENNYAIMTTEIYNQAIEAMEKVEKVKRCIREADVAGIKLHYGAWCFMDKIVKIVGSEFE